MAVIDVLKFDSDWNLYPRKGIFGELQTILKMSQTISKKDILDTCIRKQQELIQNFNDRIDEVKSEAFSHTETPSQTDDVSGASDEMLEVMGQELKLARSEMEILRSIDPQNAASQVERGAVVVTDQRIFFIGVSSEGIEVHGTKVFGMSEKAPLYGQMKGLKKGDGFQFNGTRYMIEEIN